MFWKKRFVTIREEVKNECLSVEDRFVNDIKRYMSYNDKKLQRLKEMELFIVDNSMRETTVASLKAHTIENKRAIYKEIKKAGMKYYIIESFGHETRVGDKFLEELLEAKEDISNSFAFAECWEKYANKIPQPDLSIGLVKCKRYKVNNVILELDLMYYKIDYDTFNMKELCKFLLERINWIRSNLSKDSMIFANIRDFSSCMLTHPERVRYVVNFLACLPTKDRITGIAYEDMGRTLKHHLSVWTAAVRNEMVRCGWEEGEFIVHIHEQWGMGNAINMECLAMGATGMWAGLCAEGAGIGHVDTTTTIINLIRLGNTKVEQQFNCKYLREAAINITKITSGELPNPKQPVYGERALDMVSSDNFAALIYGYTTSKGFHMADYLGMKKEIRITTRSSREMIVLKLKEMFGEDPQFTVEMGEDMKRQMLSNATEGKKQEYNSYVGLAQLLEQAGGELTEEMIEAINLAEDKSLHITRLIEQIKKEWDTLDSRDGEHDDHLTFDDFYFGFMQPYFGGLRCEDSLRGLEALDVDEDGLIEWNEFKFYLIWAGRQYPNVENRTQLLDFAFREGLIPAMREEMVKLECIRFSRSSDLKGMLSLV